MDKPPSGRKYFQNMYFRNDISSIYLKIMQLNNKINNLLRKQTKFEQTHPKKLYKLKICM